MIEEQYIRQVAELNVESFIDYARRNYGWDNVDFELFREPMENIAVTVAIVVSTKQNAELKNQIKKMKGNSKTAYIKGIRTMANALKKYDREEGSYTDYFEHTVDKVLKNLLKELGE